MKFEIKSRFSGKILFSIEAASLKVAVEVAVSKDAYLQDAYLQDADLRDTYLRDADLQGAKGFNKLTTTPLYMLLDQTGKIRAYKLVNRDYEGPYYGGLKYIIGKTIEVKDVDKDENVQCGAGISLATLDWCLKEHSQNCKILLCEFTKKDIACIPVGSGGKFRVKKCKVVKELNLKQYGVD